jgi:hypothetical protein
MRRRVGIERARRRADGNGAGQYGQDRGGRCDAPMTEVDHDCYLLDLWW